VPVVIASLGLTILVAAVDPSADWLGRATGPVVLALVVVALLRGTLVTGREADGLRAERDKALELVYKQAEVAQRALEVSEKK
jgi:hypothetical protein